MKALLKSFGDAMQAMGSREKAAGLSEITGAQGGYTVPPELAMVIDEGAHEQSIFGTYAYPQPMVTETCTLPRLDLTVSHATGVSPMYGGLSATWFGENLAVPLSQPSTGAIVLKAKNAGFLLYCSNQLVQDGGEALGSYLMNAFTGALAFEVDRQCFNGVGTTMPLGIFNSPATKLVTRQGPAAITQLDLANLVGALLPCCFKRAIWCCSTTALTKIANFSTYMANRNSDSALGNGLCGTLFGRPLLVTEQCSPLGTKGDLCLFDPMLYALGTRSLIIDQAYEEPGAFFRNQTVYRAIWRGDGKPLVNGTATLADGSTTAAAFCVLN